VTPTRLRSRRVLTHDGVRPASLRIEDGRIARIDPWEQGSSGLDLGEWLVMPGLVDVHVHVNEPGRADWEGFATATRAALAGGITTILDMPLNSIPATVSVSALEAKRASAQAQAAIEVQYIGGLIPGNLDQLEPMARAGVRAFKCFLCPSGIPEFPAVQEADLENAWGTLARIGLPLMVHAELPNRLRTGAPSREYADYLSSRPVEAEREAIALVTRLLESGSTPIHIVHLSSASSLEPIRAARRRGLPVTVETCPHYLTFAAEEIPPGATEFKCAPPLRGAAEREALWSALIGGEIDLIASDHSPCPPSLKATGGDFFAAWGGIASLELTLAAVWTGARKRGIAPERLAEWMSAAPARFAGLDRRKGAIADGFDADLVFWDPEEEFVVDPGHLHQRHPVTPYAGRRLHGVVHGAMSAGRIIPA